MSKYIYLSHFINQSTPIYGGGVGINIIPDKSISKGDSANTHLLSFPNHIGTHIDFPYHFSNEGKKSSDYSPEFWFFKNPFVINYQAGESEIITLENEIEKITTGCDFLIINTGFQRFRDEEKYWKFNPGIHPDLASKLKEKGVKVIGFDFISLSSYQNRELGRRAHRAFLMENDILIVEDMDLNKINSKINNIMCIPLQLEAMDGTPVTILGEIDE